jgi:exodeoxyribonuclease VII small subunit
MQKKEMAKKELTYTDAQRELEEIVAKMESGDIDIDILTVLVTRANFLIEFCETKLLKVEKEVKQALKSDKESQG